MYFTNYPLIFFCFSTLTAIFCITSLGIVLSLMSYEFSSINEIVSIKMKDYNNDADIAFKLLVALEKDDDTINNIFKKFAKNIEMLTDENKEIIMNHESNGKTRIKKNEYSQIFPEPNNVGKETYVPPSNTDDKYPEPQYFQPPIYGYSENFDDGYVTPGPLLQEDSYSSPRNIESNFEKPSSFDQCPNPMFINEKCPPGVPGKNGLPGIPGIDGFPGIPGRDGSSHKNANGMYIDKDIATCISCPVGIPGFRGIPGEKGNPGAKGSTGARGQPGKPGIIGLEGEPGIDGPSGIQGPIGEPGPQGEQGYHYYGEPKRGPRGIPGGPGESGIPGIPGLHGIRGRAGPRGPVGEKGKEGKVGSEGVIGREGPIGDDGPDRLYCECNLNDNHNVTQKDN
uniref:Col_cuticle_N domain-containing protein n=1 Tax=Parastrongyloides trichosuri TaxID=131310 RepID=A0A0N4ZWH3_PARTI